MNITVNGSQHNCPQQANISQLLELLEMRDKRIALEINKEIIPKAEYDSHTLNEGDNIEIIQAIGGG